MREDLDERLPSGRLNIRAGAIIVKEGKVLFIQSEHYYTVGGRIRFGEDSREAVCRELKEELGTHAKLLDEGKLIAIEENFFHADGVNVHEFGYYYLFDGSRLPAAEEMQLMDCTGRLVFLSPEEMKRKEALYPAFLKRGIPTRFRRFVNREEDFV